MTLVTIHFAEIILGFSIALVGRGILKGKGPADILWNTPAVVIYFTKNSL
jgi:hypothetical protein